MIKLNDIVLWSYLDHLPKVPSDLLATIDVSGQPTKANYGNATVKNAYYDKYPCVESLDNWLRTNISNDIIEYVACKTWFDEYPVNHKAHIDLVRDWTLGYVLDQGGNNVYTKFFTDSAYKLVVDRELAIANGVQDQYKRFSQWTHLEQIAEVKIETNRWFLLNARVIHEVNGLSSPRISIHAGALNPDALLAVLP